MNKPLFEVDAKGLARIQGDKPKGRILAELWQNAKDEDGVQNVRLNVKLMQGRPLAQFSIEDDSPKVLVTFPMPTLSSPLPIS